jgi:hypothetical protein
VSERRGKESFWRWSKRLCFGNYILLPLATRFDNYSMLRRKMKKEWKV